MRNRWFHFSTTCYATKRIFFLFFVCWSFPLTGITQPKVFTTSNAHAHNDYLHPVPFHTAYNAGFGSIEADIFPVNGNLFVAHYASDIQPGRTIKSLYLGPLLKELSGDKARPIKLLVDIKEDYEQSLDLLKKETEVFKPYLSTPKKMNLLTILISGKRPVPTAYKNYPGYFFFDDDLKLPHKKMEWKRVGQVSLPFTKFSSWNGKKSIPVQEEEKIKSVIDSVHLAGKTIRFWAAPDTEDSWALQMKLGVDLIGTDKIEELSAFINNRHAKN
ncbi:MAG: hypothetical protein ACSLE0_07280 [Chitinophagaceae bacterium]